MRSEVQPLRIEVYGSDYVRRGWVADPVSVNVELRHNAAGSAELTVPLAHSRIDDLLAPGARVVIDFDPMWDTDDHGASWLRIITGRVASWTASGPSRSGAATFTVEDDLTALDSLLGWQVPDSPISNQSASAYRTVTGPVETVLKTLVNENAARIPGVRMSCGPDLGRGSSVTVQTRMHAISEKLIPLINASGLGVTVRQYGTTRVVDVHVPSTYPRPLTEESGALRGWELTSQGPVATRVVVAGQGEAVARAFRLYVDTAREAEWGQILESFVDARDIDDEAADMEDLLAARGAEKLAEAGPTTSARVTLGPGMSTRYGIDLTVGDLLPIQIGSRVILDILRVVTISWSNDSGVNITPQIGERAGDPVTTFVQSVARLARRVSTLGRA